VVEKRDVFPDVTSGRKNAADRPGMQKLLEHATSGDTIVVWRIDRLGRSLLDVLNTVSGLREQGIQVRSISDGIDPATATGRLMLNMLATLAEYERELIVERVRAGVAVAQEAGTRFGRPKSDPAIVGQKLALVAQARAEGRHRRGRRIFGRLEPSHLVPTPARARTCAPLPPVGRRGEPVSAQVPLWVPTRRRPNPQPPHLSLH
jgi:DNA invertase Pin-like site-specific DNA recombinase